VPRFTVLVRKAYGGAYITMNSKELGADLVLAWPGSQVGVMGSRAAVHILHRRELAGSAEPEARAQALADEYAASNIAVERALELGLVDAIIAPRGTRRRLSSALQRAG
jgi:acetyl-CoA carboxylase carboxyltransferase component